MYRPQDMALPPSFHHGNRPLARSVAWALAQRESGKAVVTEQAAFAVDEREAREAMALSCGMIAMIDDADRPHAGAARGERAGRRHDRDLHHRPRRFSRRSPADAERPGAFRRDHPCAVHLGRAGHAAGAHEADVLGGTLDIAATILDRARIQPYNGIQGESLLPAIAGEGAVAARFDGDRGRPAARHPRLSGAAAPAHARHAALAHDHRPWRPMGRALRPAERSRTRWTICSTIPAHRGVRGELMEKLAYRQMELADRSPLPMGRA